MLKEDHPTLYKKGNATVYVNGQYEFQEEGASKIGGSIYEVYDITSVQFNKLKGKLYNLIEASVPDKSQQEAIKGLIKGFCNTGYKNTMIDLEGLLLRMGLIAKQSFDWWVSEPLEGRTDSGK